MRRFVPLAALALAACATTAQPPLYTASQRDLAGPALTAALLEDARVGQIDFAQRYQSATRTSDLSNLPLIAAATATAALLFGSASDTAVFAVGLGAGSYVATREVLSPKRLAGLYLEGHGGLGCVRRHAAPFAGAAAEAKRAAFEAALDAIRVALADADAATLIVTPDGASPSETATFLATQARLRDALLAGRQQESTAEREATAFESASGVVAGALEGVYARITGQSRVGRDVDFTQLTQALFQGGQASVPAAPDAGPAAPPMIGASAGSAQQSAAAALRALTVTSGRLRSQTPAYGLALAKVAACPGGAR